MSTAEKAAAFQVLLRRPGHFVSAHPWNIGTAKVLTSLGFEALGTASSGLAFALGRRDAENAINRDEMLSWAGGMAAATHLPMSADLENGFGDRPEDCALTITRAGHAGLVAGTIEDATGRDHKLYDTSAAAERIAAAAQSAKTLPFPFAVVARADGFLHGHRSLDDVLARVQAYEAAGASMIFAPGISDLAGIRTLCKTVRVPVIVLVGRGAAVTVQDLADAGVKEISLGSALMRSAWGVLFAAAKEVREKGTFNFESASAPYDALNNLMGKPRGT